jgi:hypothetical protein
VKGITVLYLGDQWDDLWRRRQQIASRLASNRLVTQLVYVERPLTMTSLAKYAAGTCDRDAARRWRRLLQLRSPVHRVSSKLSVLTPLTAAPTTRHKRLNDTTLLTEYWWASLLGEPLLADDDGCGRLLWVSIPYVSGLLLDRYQRDWLWYDCTENFAALEHLPGATRVAFLATDECLTQEADVVSVVSRAQFLEKSRTRGEVHWIPNAVDLSIFGLCSQDGPPKDLEGIPAPRLVYVGSVNEYLDWGLIEQIASTRPEWSILLLGPVTLTSRTGQLLDRLPSVHLLGVRPYEALPSYMTHCDVCMQFYVPGRAPSYESTQKMFLYLASGKPIVTYALLSETEVSGLAATAQDRSEYVAHIDDLLNHDTEDQARRRKEFASMNTWDRRMAVVTGTLARLVGSAG